jgi:hypothetical protein
MRLPHLFRAILLVTVIVSILALPAQAQEWKFVETVRVGPGRPAAPAVNIKQFDDGREVIKVSFNAYDIWEFRHLRQTFTSVEFPGCGYTRQIGEPEVPIWSKILKLVGNEKIIFENVSYKWSEKELYGRWIPSQRSFSDLHNMNKLQINPKTYKSENDVFADSRISLSPLKKIWNDRYLTINLQPFQYFPAKGSIKVLQEATITLRRFNRPKNDANQERVVRKHSGYLIITPEKFIKTLQPFINFKKKQHPDLKIAILEKIGNSVEKIDAVIEKECSRGTEYVLLVGHTSILASQGYKSPWNRTGKIDCKDADFVYRNQGNNKFPSYMIGRLPVETEAELETVIAKMLRRWKYSHTYQTRPMLIAHEEQAPGKYQGCVQNILNSVISNSRIKLTPKVVFPASVGRGGLASRKEDFYKYLASGVGVMLYRGHGGTDFLATRYLDYWGSRQQHWYEMKAAIPPVFYSVACLNGQLTDPEGKRVNGLCENLLTSSAYGVSATIGAIQPSPTTANHTFAWHLMYYTYVEPKSTIGEIFQKATMETMKYGFANVKYTDEWEWIGDLYNLYGDPEMPVTNIRK